MVQEKTFIAIKPDGVQRGLISQVVSKFEQKGLKLIGIKMVKATQSLLTQHYSDLQDKPFFSSLMSYMLSGPILAMVWEGKQAVAIGRSILGATDPLKSAPGTIRGDFAIDTGRNIVHGSDSVKSAEKEINLWFQKNELVDYDSATFRWVYE